MPPSELIILIEPFFSPIHLILLMLGFVTTAFGASILMEVVSVQLFLSTETTKCLPTLKPLICCVNCIGLVNHL